MTNMNNESVKKDKNKYIEIDVSDIPGSLKRAFNHLIDFSKEAFSEVFGIKKNIVCQHCGKSLPSGVNFCIYCGGEIKHSNNVEEKDVSKEGHKIIKLPKMGLAIGVGAIALVAVVLVALSSLGVFRRNISVLNEDSIVFQGSNGYGTAVINKSLQTESELLEDYLAEMYGNADNKKMAAYETVLYNYSCDITSDNNGRLQNGDKVKVTCDYAENSKKMVDNALKTLGLKFTDTEREYTVSGLPDMEYIDLFSGLKTGWTAQNGQAIPYVDFEKGSKLEGINYDSEYNTNTGELKVFVTNSVEEIIERYNAIGELEKTINIGKTPQLITTLDAEEDKQAALKGVEEGFQRNSNGCGWLLDQSDYGTVEPKQISSHEVQKIEPGETMIGYTYVKASDSKGDHRYLKAIRFNMFKHEDGTYSYKFIDSEHACATSGDNWTNNE